MHQLTRAGSLSAILLIIVSLLVTTAQVRAAQPLAGKTACPTPVTAGGASPAPLVTGEKQFSFRLFHALYTSPDRNLFLSPLSVSVALDMLYDGARAATATAMTRTLGLAGLSRLQVRRDAAAWLAALQANSQARLEIANSVWARQGVVFKRAFLQHLAAFYGAKVSTLNFDSPAAPAAINGWVSCATHGTIPSIIDSIDPASVMYLLNAVYFRGTWATQFSPTLTKPHPFTTAAGGTVQVPMMHEGIETMYYAGTDFQLISLPYTRNESMLVLLPRSGESLATFSRGMTATSWSGWISHLAFSRGTIAFPRFGFSYAATLNGALTSLGMGDAFRRTANFSGICRQHCQVSKVIHKTYLHVDEKGTVASAATGIAVTVTAAPASTQPFNMVVDHPFLLAIRDGSTGAILFLGAVADPSAKS